jgi:hypothetical protein
LSPATNQFTDNQEKEITMETIDYDRLAADQAAADEIREPGITARRAAARDRERMVREARMTTERQYRELLTAIVQGQKPDPIELTRLATALGRSELDITDDAEEREAQLADEAEARRVEEEKADLNNQIAELREQARTFKAKADETYATCNDLKTEIERKHSRVALDEKAAFQTTLKENQAALENHRNANARIGELMRALGEVRPWNNHVAQLRQRRFQQKHEAKERESDAARARYVTDEVPDKVIRAAINPPFEPEESTQSSGSRRVRLGQVNGKDVVVEVGRLG